MSFGSLKTEAGLKELDSFLAGNTYIEGGASASQADFDLLAQATGSLDAATYAHVHRWAQHLRGLKAAFPYRQWGRAGDAKGGGGAAGRGGAAGGAGADGGKGKDQARLEGLLPNAEMGKVCTRFPPEPSGYLHIGHAKAAMLNNHYARHYKGKLILRFDDTNPSKEKEEFEDSIKHDLGTLQVFPDKVTHTSDHFEKLQTMMEKLIKSGKAYIDDTEVDQMRAERDAGTESKRRGNSTDENLRLWKEMLAGSPEGLKCCVRGKLDMQSKNKCLRDPVFYRCKVDTPHHKTGTTYKAYPTYDFACPCVDSIEGVTHALRTIEYKDRDEMYKWVLEATGSRKVELVEFSKTQFSHTILSKRKLTWFVENGYVEGWNDPRFPTVQGVLRRGMTVEGLSEFVMTQGMSKATNLMEWDKIWAINKQKIDPVVPRYAAVGREGAVLLKLDGPSTPSAVREKKHPKNDELGERIIIQNNQVWVEQEDAADITEGEQVTLLHWGNIFVDKVNKDKSGKVVDMVGRLNLQGNVKDTKKKIHWVSKLDDQVTPILLREFDHIVTKPKIEDDDDIKSIINPCSVVDTQAIGDPSLKTLPKGTKMQLERRGYFIIDSLAFPPGAPLVLVKIPDGKAKDMGMASKVDVKKLQGARGEKSGGDKDKEEAKGGDKKAEAKAQAKADPKAKAKAAAGKPADRPVEDITRLNIKVGKITKVWAHPDSDKLYCEEIDLGEPTGPRSIASGLRKHVTEQEMLGAMVVVLCNLKPKKIAGFESQGMVLCATSEDGSKTELLKAPAGAKIGERVNVEGVEMLEADEKLNEKTGKAPLVACSPNMKTTADKKASYSGQVWMTSAGPVTCASVGGGKIS